MRTSGFRTYRWGLPLLLGLTLATGALAPGVASAMNDDRAPGLGGSPAPVSDPGAGAGTGAAATAAYPAGHGGFANPGVVYDGTRWVLLSTGSWSANGRIAVADAASGPYRRLDRHLLTARPAWSSATDHSVWAPSIVRASDGHYVVFYAGVVKGTSGRRCIGTAHASRSTGPFTPNSRPIACWSGSGTHPYDAIASEGSGFGLIDPTPAKVGSTLVLTYKTEHSYRGSSGQQLWHTTTRMLKLDPASPDRPAANPVHADGSSIRITDARSRYIEENPVMVERGGRYTLFTSYGWWGTCTYHTRYRQNARLWTGWLAKRPTALSMPSGTCGTGNAQVVRGLPQNSWRIFYNGHISAKRRSPFTLYVGWVAWHDGKPSVPGRL